MSVNTKCIFDKAIEKVYSNHFSKISAPIASWEDVLEDFVTDDTSAGYSFPGKLKRDVWPEAL